MAVLQDQDLFPFGFSETFFFLCNIIYNPGRIIFSATLKYLQIVARPTLPIRNFIVIRQNVSLTRRLLK